MRKLSLAFWAAICLCACTGVRTSDGSNTFYGEIRSGFEVSHTRLR